jgi:hypothetical protein
VPEAVRSRPHQSTLSFQAYVDKSAFTRSVSLRAVAGDAVAEDRISIQAASGAVLSVPGKQFVSIGSSVSFRVGAFSQSGATPALMADSLPSGSRFEGNTGDFDWTPQSSQAGSWDVVFTAKDDAQRSSTGHVSIRVGSGNPVIESLQTAANGSTEVVLCGLAHHSERRLAVKYYRIRCLRPDDGAGRGHGRSQRNERSRCFFFAGASHVHMPEC